MFYLAWLRYSLFRDTSLPPRKAGESPTASGHQLEPVVFGAFSELLADSIQSLPHGFMVQHIRAGRCCLKLCRRAQVRLGQMDWRFAVLGSYFLSRLGASSYRESCKCQEYDVESVGCERIARYISPCCPGVR